MSGDNLDHLHSEFEAEIRRLGIPSDVKTSVYRENGRFWFKLVLPTEPEIQNAVSQPPGPIQIKKIAYHIASWAYEKTPAFAEAEREMQQDAIDAGIDPGPEYELLGAWVTDWELPPPP